MAGKNRNPQITKEGIKKLKEGKGFSNLECALHFGVTPATIAARLKGGWNRTKKAAKKVARKTTVRKVAKRKYKRRKTTESNGHLRPLNIEVKQGKTMLFSASKDQIVLRAQLLSHKKRRSNIASRLRELADTIDV